jgi:hypothetical protein
VVSEPGGRIVVWSWGTTALFTVVAVAYALGVSPLKWVAVALCGALFLASLVVWVYAYALAVVRTSRGDDVTVPSLFFLSSGAAPKTVRRHLMGSLTVVVVVAIATVKDNPFGALVPMLALGLAGLWAARHGTFPPRAGFDRASTSASRRSDGRPGK